MIKNESKLFNEFVPYRYYGDVRHDWTVDKDSYYGKPGSPLDFFNSYRKHHNGSFKEQLCGYLNDNTTIEYKIQWLLDHKGMSDQKLADRINSKPYGVHCIQQQIQQYRTGKRSIRNMTLKLAEALAWEAIGMINSKLL